MANIGLNRAQSVYHNGHRNLAPRCGWWEPFSNRASLVNRFHHQVPPPSWFSPRSVIPPQHLVRSIGAARSTTGSDDVLPNGYLRSRLSLRPLGNPLSSIKYCRCALQRVHVASVGDAQRNGSPERQMLWRITVSLRANATRALPEPDRRAIASAHSLSLEPRLTRVRMTTAASYISVRASASPHLDILPLRSISPG